MTDKDPGAFLCRVEAPSGKASVEAFADRSVGAQKQHGVMTVHYRINFGRQVLNNFTLSSAVDPEVLWSVSGAWLGMTGAPDPSGPWQPRLFKVSAAGVQPVPLLKAAVDKFTAELPLCVGEGAEKFCDKADFHSDLQRELPAWLDIWPLAWQDNAHTLALLMHVPNETRYGANVGRSAVYVVSTDDGRVVGAYSGVDAVNRFGKDLRNASTFLVPH